MHKGIIYKYESPSAKVYIGQTMNEKKRRQDFFNTNQGYAGDKINNARQKYGPENFEYEVLFSIESEDIDEIRSILNIKEKYYIQEYNSVEAGYNITYGGDYVDYIITKPVSEDTRKKHSEAMKKRYSDGYKVELSETAINSIKDKLSIPILQYDMEGNFIREWKSSKEAGEVLRVASSLITKVCKFQNNCCRNFIFRYKESENFPTTIDVSYLSDRLKNNPNLYKNGKSNVVIQYNSSHEEMNRWNSVKEAAYDLGYAASTLAKYCRGKNNNYYKGYYYIYG